jgi:hypothetical protein
MVELRSTKTANVNNRPLGENLTNLVNLTEIAAWRHYLFCQKNGQNIYFAKKMAKIVANSTCMQLWTENVYY